MKWHHIFLCSLFSISLLNQACTPDPEQSMPQNVQQPSPSATAIVPPPQTATTDTTNAPSNEPRSPSITPSQSPDSIPATSLPEVSTEPSPLHASSPSPLSSPLSPSVSPSSPTPTPAPTTTPSPSATPTASSSASPSPSSTPIPTPEPNFKTTGIWPISNSTTPDCIQDPFGHRLLSGSNDFHAGLDTCNDDPDDINGTNTETIVGSDIHAPLAGIVSRIRPWDPDWDENPENCPSFCRQGNFLMLRHPEIESEYGGQVVQTVYMHLAQNSMDHLSLGQSISQGDVLGQVSNTGENINTVHLHLGLLVGSSEGLIDADHYWNPMAILPHSQITPTLSLLKDTDLSGFDSGECPAALNRLALTLTQSEPDFDLVKIEVFPPEGTPHVIDMNQRTGIGINGNQDDFEHACTAVSVENFNESSTNYTLTISFGGNFQSGNYTIHLTNVHEEVTVLQETISP